MSAHEQPRRWRLHRGGIVNVWQYAEHTFDLSGGRAIFQGTNGSGKSRTLELLLPLCLDGDLRQLGSKGFDTVSVRRLMLDEYPGGPNRVGYAWIELRREDDEGTAEFLTCGVGIKASKTSQAISDSWRFVTSQRVGGDLRLVGADRVPLGPAQLREVLGADSVLDEQAFRAKIAATVYGMPAARYGDLLHLQRTLRNPDVGLKVLEGQLEQILSDALPPLDPALIERLATSFDDLESIRENIVRLTAADKALDTFLSTYSGYALGSLRERAESMRTARSRLDALREELSGLDEQVDGALRERESTEQRIADLDKREGELETSIDALRAHPSYAELQNLHDRQQLVDSAKSAAATALDTAGRHRAQEERSTESVVGALRRLSHDVEAARQATANASRQLSAAGLDGALLSTPPEVAAAPATAEREQVRADPDPEAELATVERHVAPPVDVDGIAEACQQRLSEAESAAAAAKQRSALTFALHQQALELDAEQEKVTEAHRLARQQQLTATEAAGRRNQARQDLDEAASNWVEQVSHWRREWPTDVDDVPEPPSPQQLRDDRASSRRAEERMREWARPHLRAARQRVTDAELRLDELRSTSSSYETELAELRSGRERAPTRPEWTGEDVAGTAFHRLVDFAPSLDAQQRAGLEAALQASGLLTAEVSADGRPHGPGAGQLRAVADREVDGGTLADLLVPSSEPGSPVTEERILALLRSVPTDEDAGPGLRLTSSGSWRAGVLRGQWSKSTAEFVGAGARETARTRRIAEIEDALAQLRAEFGEAEREHRSAGEHVAALERHVESYPDDSEVLGAHAKVDTALDTAQEAEDKAAHLRQQHEQAQQRWQATQSELVRSAGEADLDADSRTLEAARRAATEACSAIDDVREVVASRCLPSLEHLRDSSAHHDAAVADRMAAESQAETSCAEYQKQASGLAELTAAGDGEAQRISEQVAGLEQERGRIRAELPQAREELSGLRESAARLRTQRENKRSQLATRESDAESAVEDFRRALRIPGLRAAAGLSEEDGNRELAEVADLLAAATGKSSTESAVLNRFQALQQALSGTYDITAGEQDGLLTVTVTGEEGPQPAAEAARRVAERLEHQRGYLNERYQSIFADYLIRDLAERLRGQIAVADDLCRRMNDVLEGARSSQGVHVQLEWEPSAALGDDIRAVIDLVRTPFANRSEDQDALLRRVFTDLIESERDSASGGYAEILARALDYRSWFAFTVRVRDTGPEGKPRVRRLRQLSSGETRLISYVTLFAAAAAFYDATSTTSAGRGPLRLVLLDEAFERLDDPTVARMLGLLVDLDMDWMITWPSGWGVSPKIPKMHIYDILRPRSGHGVACTHTTWNGSGLERADGT